MKTREKAEKIINDLGQPKDSTLRRRGKLSEGPEIQQSIFKICRSIMRHPSKEITDQLYFLHSRLGILFLQMSDEGIDWLIGGALEARGGFRPTEKASAAEKVKDFLKSKPDDIPIQKLITGIESITTAMSNRLIGAEWEEHPHEPETIAQWEIYELLQLIVGPYLLEPIGKVYTDRESDKLPMIAEADWLTFLINPEYAAERDRINKIDRIETKAEDVSSESDIEEKEKEVPLFIKKMNNNRYRTYASPNIKDKNFTWPGAAHKSGIPIRAHVSGTAPLTLAAIEGLYSFSTKEAKPNLWFKEKSNAEALSAALIIAPYQRGDFHTIAESAAGIEYFLNTRDKNTNEPMQPHKAFEKSLDMLATAASNSIPLKSKNPKAKVIESVNLRAAIVTLKEPIVKLTKKIDANLAKKHIESDSKIEVDKELKDEDLESEDALLFFIEDSPLTHLNFDSRWKKIKDILQTHIKSADSVAILFKNTDEQYHSEIYNTLREILPKLIQSAYDFSIIANCFNKPLRMQIYKDNKEHLLKLIKTVNDFSCIVQHLTTAECVEIYKLLSQKKSLPIPNIPLVKENSFEFLLMHLPSEQCRDVGIYFQKQIPEIIKTIKDLLKILKKLNPLQRVSFFKTSEDYFLSLVDSISNLNLVGGHLNSAEREKILKNLMPRLSELVRDKNDFVAVLEYKVNPLERNKLFQQLKYLLPTIIRSGNDIDSISRNLNADECRELYALLTGPAAKNLKSYLELIPSIGKKINIVSSLEKKQCVEILNTIKSEKVADSIAIPSFFALSYIEYFHQSCLPLILAIFTENIEETSKYLEDPKIPKPLELREFAEKINNKEINELMEKSRVARIHGSF